MNQPDFDQLTNVRRVADGRYSPDGRYFAYLADTTGRMQLWVQPAGGGFARQLTAVPGRRVTDFRWSHDSRRIAFLADLDGNEMHQLFVTDFSADATDWPRQLTDRPEVQFQLSGWTPDGQIVASGNDRDPTDVDPLIVDPDSGEMSRLMEGGLHYAGEMSPDGKWLTITALYGNSDSDIILYDVQAGTHRNLTAHDGMVLNFPDRWSPDSSGFYAISDRDSEFLHLRHYSLDSGEFRVLDNPDRDIDGIVLSPDERVIVTVENDNGASVLSVFDRQAGEKLTTAPLPYGVVHSLSIHPDGDTVLLGLTTAREPTNLFEFGLHSGSLERREQSMLGGVDPEDLLEPQLISYPSFDRDIPAWLFVPAGEGPFPVVLSIHGGPEAQERPSYAYQGLYQYLVSRGIAVLAPNIRGSTGYGKSYQKLIQRDWGGGELKDIEAAARWLQEQEWADAGRMAIWGASFGGFATLSALSRLPDYWRTGAAAVGPANLVTFAGSVPPHWKPMIRNFVGDPDDDREMLTERSPLTYVNNIRVPLLVYQGANDPRVVKAESDQMVEALRARGMDVEYIVDEKSGHGPADAASAVRWWRDIALYLERQLKS